MCSFLYLVFSLLFLSRVNCFDDPSIVIIGAGAAGIAAATKLYQNGFKNITILEAENRIGGRIYSLQFGETYIDLGAQWCHGQENNVVYEMVKDLKILKDDKMYPRLCHSKRKLIDEKFSLKLIEIFETLYGDVNIDERGSMGEYLIKQ
ncbi:hypothetical protein RI129_005780 [Pyrocoelia pectoralis]|uniref:Amine oxidase domain-containing protein n=1 Tax=Pyrocoelia pectoralis TaxID=417401 RepID=A0AAN7ZFM7_9COLE